MTNASGEVTHVERSYKSPSFFTRVRSEARAAWWGRFRWLWITAAVAVTLWVGFTPDLKFLEDPGFLAVCALACWGPAWLCSDLMSLRFGGNPEPHREWSPGEFCARALGRLAPFFLAEAVWVGIYTARSLVQHLGQLAGASIPEFAGRLQLPQWWIAWATVIVLSGLPYAGVAALLSALTRRPRRALVTPATVLLWSLAALWIVELSPVGGPLMGERSTTPLPAILQEWRQFLLAPNYWVGASTTIALSKVGHPVFQWFMERDFAGFCWLATLTFLLHALLLTLAIWWVAARRFRRHPYTGTAPGVAAPVLP